MSIDLQCCVFCVLMLSALVQFVFCAALGCGYQHMTGVESSTLHLCRHTGRSSVANVAVGIQHTQQQLPTCFGFADCWHQKQQGGLSPLSCVAPGDALLPLLLVMPYCPCAC